MTTMLRCGSQIRLTRPEVETFLEITTFDPGGVRTVAELLAYVQECKWHYRGSSHASRFLHWLIDRQLARCFHDSVGP